MKAYLKNKLLKPFSRKTKPDQQSSENKEADQSEAWVLEMLSTKNKRSRGARSLPKVEISSKSQEEDFIAVQQEYRFPLQEPQRSKSLNPSKVRKKRSNHPEPKIPPNSPLPNVKRAARHETNPLESPPIYQRPKTLNTLRTHKKRIAPPELGTHQDKPEKKLPYLDAARQRTGDARRAVRKAVAEPNYQIARSLDPLKAHKKEEEQEKPARRRGSLLKELVMPPNKERSLVDQEHKALEDLSKLKISQDYLEDQPNGNCTILDFMRGLGAVQKDSDRQQ